MDGLFDFVMEKYSWLIDSYMIEYFIKDLWNKLPFSWRLALENMEPEDCLCLVDASAPCKNRVLPLAIICLKLLASGLPSREAVKSPDEVAKACGISNTKLHYFSSITAANNLRTKLKPKKQYEIDRIVIIVELLRECDSTPMFNTVIDIGAGMGHLARILSVSLPECVVYAVEQNEEVRSVLLNERLQRISENFRAPEHHCESVQAGFSGSVLRSLEQGQKVLLIGLHPCGDLSVSILRIFAKSPEVKRAILFGCCYHKVSAVEEKRERSELDSGECGFPMSSKYREKYLSYAARDLACHGNESFAKQLLVKPHSAYRLQCYRAVLEWLIVNSQQEQLCRQRESLVVHSVTSKNGMSFVEYMRSALVKYPDIAKVLEEQTRYDEKSELLINSVEKEWRHLLVVHCLRLLFAPIIEQIMIRDRVQYLEEFGHSVAVVPLFDPRISPRNFALIAMKK
ncbi:hypothetical protein RB195_021608 [Necator americanus]|uniref:Methyltransferase domain-containing protein n=1 Tax=Necator americanus TaxID=51031 RepID=A0ABR1EBW9_NECAM